MAQALDDAFGQLVRRRRRVQKARLKVNSIETHWRCIGLDAKQGGRSDDLIPEESDTVLLALKRLPPKEAYDRVFRLRRAFQVRLTAYSHANQEAKAIASAR